MPRCKFVEQEGERNPLYRVTAGLEAEIEILGAGISERGGFKNVTQGRRSGCRSNGNEFLEGGSRAIARWAVSPHVRDNHPSGTDTNVDRRDRWQTCRLVDDAFWLHVAS